MLAYVGWSLPQTHGSMFAFGGIYVPVTVHSYVLLSHFTLGIVATSPRCKESLPVTASPCDQLLHYVKEQATDLNQNVHLIIKCMSLSHFTIILASD